MDAAAQGGEALPQVAALSDLVGGSGDEHASLVDDGHVRAQLLDGGHHVRGENDGAAATRVVGEDLADVRRGNGVHGLERFVEDQDSRRVDEGGGQGNLLRHARRVVADQLLPGLGQVEGREEFVSTLAGDGRVQAVEHAHVDEEVRAG